MATGEEKFRTILKATGVLTLLVLFTCGARSLFSSRDTLFERHVDDVRMRVLPTNGLAQPRVATTSETQLNFTASMGWNQYREWVRSQMGRDYKEIVGLPTRLEYIRYYSGDKVSVSIEPDNNTDTTIHITIVAKPD